MAKRYPLTESGLPCSKPCARFTGVHRYKEIREIRHGIEELFDLEADPKEIHNEVAILLMRAISLCFAVSTIAQRALV
jgi:hypothetical protein